MMVEQVQKKRISVPRMSEDGIKEFAKEVLDGVWIYPDPDFVKEEPMIRLNLGLIKRDYEEESLKDLAPWIKNVTWARGYQRGDIRLVHIEDHKEIVKRVQRAREAMEKALEE